MDFHTLTRKALQALCKQNGIPANITNVAMADSLSALPHVEGLEELLNQSPEKFMIGSASVSRTAARTTTRRAATKKTVGEEVEQEKAEFPPKTPAAPSTRRRAPAASARQKTETLTETTSVQRAYSTRRSVRLLGKTMSKMSLDQENTMASSIDELSADTMDCSEQSESSVVKGSDMQTVSEGTSNGIDVSEVVSELKSSGQVMDECLVKDSKMDVTEVQKDGLKLESGMKSQVSAPKAALDVIKIAEVMDESSEKSSADKQYHCEGAQNLVIVKDSADVIASQSAPPQEVNEPPSAVETVEVISSTLSSSPTKSPTSKISDVNVAATIIEPKTEALGDYSGKFDFESGSKMEGDPEDEVISSTLSSSPTKSPTSKISDVNVAATIIEPKTEALGDYSGKFDFESGSSMEGDSEDEGTEDESVDEASSELQDNMNDTRKASEEENSDDESTDEGESSEEEVSDDDITEYESSEDEAIADGKAEVTQASSPLLVNLATQFPRPTSAMSSGKKRPEITMCFSDDNEESLDTTTEMHKDDDIEEVEMKKKVDLAKEFEAKSLRQLKKLLKSQLNIGDNKSTKVEERVALSEVPENQMVVKDN